MSYVESSEVMDRTYIACLESRFHGAWKEDSAGHYTAKADNAFLDLVRLDGTRKYMRFKSGAIVSTLYSNVITYLEDDFGEFLAIDESKRGKSGGHISR